MKKTFNRPQVRIVSIEDSDIICCSGSGSQPMVLKIGDDGGSASSRRGREIW